MSSAFGSLDLEENLSACEQALNYQFQDRALLLRCLTHSSIARTRLDSNERLEVLGDAILGTSVCELLFHRFPEKTEGELTRIPPRYWLLCLNRLSLAIIRMGEWMSSSHF